MTGAYGIEEVPASTPGAMTCGTCGRSWADDITPAGRCPWEYDHVDEEEEDAPTADDILAELRTDHIDLHNYAWHRDGEPCLVAMTTRDCPENHQNGRTWEDAL